MMIRYNVILFSIILFSCESDKEVKEFSDQMTFTIDTVMVDAKEEFLFLNGNLNMAKIDPQNRYLYNYNWRDTKIEKVNLDGLVFEKSIALAKEGPNGVGDYLSDFYVLENGKLLVQGRNSYFWVDEEGNLLEKVDFMNMEDSGLENSDFIGPQKIFNSNELVLYGYLMNWEEDLYQITKVDLDKKTVEKTDHESLLKLKDYKINMTIDGRLAGGYGPSVIVSGSPKKVILSTNVANEALTIQGLNGDPVYHSFQSELFPDLLKKPVKTQVESWEEIQEVVKEMRSEANQGKFFADQNGNFYRFSHKLKFSEDAEDSEPTAEVFLTIFDQDLNQLAESSVKDLDFQPEFYFYKDGKIWIFKNMEDEMGFIRLSISNN
ncbi:DUF4221 family protein [Pararhodonellum marinum]|uniref:DUF4221 family protein n=1 Tax=Pararhodonellum marinum TaxID=2755358 RepID=UPI00188ED2FE|nr:DUF4221 family protein [Pararhodonellum marinum]